MSIQSAKDLIRFHEGFTREAKPDADGQWVAGWGHDLAPCPGFVCSDEQGEDWWSIDFPLAQNRAMIAIGPGPWTALNLPRQGALTDMAYELGGNGLSHFVEMLGAVRDSDWVNAKTQALNSVWAKQVPKRAEMDADILLTGAWPSP